MSNKDSYEDYVKALNKLKSNMFHYTKDGEDITEEEFENFIKVIKDKIKE